MKKVLTTIMLISIVVFAFAQNPSMTISHQGISPYDTLTVYAGDSIDFIFGGGGAHPMTEGWQSGEISTPISFETVTVTSSHPLETFALDTPGTYYFHCGTNPGNSNNWGRITVLDVVSDIETTESNNPNYKIYPNPVSDILTIENFTGSANIYDINGKMLMTIESSSIDLSSLPTGTYFIISKEINTRIIKK